MDMQQAIKSCFNQYISFSGRASRSEFWYFFLFGIILSAMAGFIDGGFYHSIWSLESLVSIVLFLPTIAVGSRRMHDSNRSEYWLLLVFIPVVGLILLFFFAQLGTEGDNQYGPDPLLTKQDQNQDAYM